MDGKREWSKLKCLPFPSHIIFPQAHYHFFISSSSTSSPHPEWHSGKGNEACDQDRTACPCCSFLFTLFSVPGMGLPGSVVLQTISHAPEWSPWAVGPQPAAPWSLSLGPEAPPPLLSPECHGTGSHASFPPPYCCATFCPFSSVFSQKCCDGARWVQPCPVEGGLELSGTGCVHPRAALTSPQRGHPCTVSWPMPGH